MIFDMDLTHLGLEISKQFIKFAKNIAIFTTSINFFCHLKQSQQMYVYVNKPKISHSIRFTTKSSENRKNSFRVLSAPEHTHTNRPFGDESCFHTVNVHCLYEFFILNKTVYFILFQYYDIRELLVNFSYFSLYSNYELNILIVEITKVKD